MSVLMGGSGVIDVTPTEAWLSLKGSEPAALIDVRTTAEWAYVGVPDLSAAGRTPILIEWQMFPHGTINSAFVDQLTAALNSEGVAADASLYFLCRSGVRSKAAAVAMIAAGWTKSFNISGGFEGSIDAGGHRGTVNGWKVDGLPWKQS